MRPAASNSALNSAVVDLLEEVLEHAVVGLEDRVLRRQVDGVVAGRGRSAATPGRSRGSSRCSCTCPSRRRRRRGNSATSHLDRLAAVGRRVGHRHRAGAGHLEVGGLVLVAVGVTADDDRLRPARHEAGDVGDDDRLAEDDAAEDVADRAVRRSPHLLQPELLDARLVGRDRGALHADAVLLGGVGGVDRDLVVGGVAVLDAEVVVVELDVEVRQDQLVLDELPDDPRHLVAVHLDDGVLPP